MNSTERKLKVGKALKITAIVFLLVFTSICNAQIVAGYASPVYEIYTDIDPDSVLIPDYSYQEQRIMELDVDQNGFKDCRFKVWGYHSGGGNGHEGHLFPLTTDFKILSHFDTSYFFNPIVGTYQFISTVPNPVDYGVPITGTIGYTNTPTTIWELHDPNQLAPVVGCWNNIGDHYIGFMLTSASDTLYGWIRVEVQYMSTWSGGITIKDYACNRGITTHVNNPIEVSNLNVYPNPCKTDFKISSTSDIKGYVTVVNSNGQVVFVQKITDKITSINTSSLKSGIYFIKIQTVDNTFVRKIVKE